MRSRFVGFASLVLVLILAGCGGKGVDKNIATDSEASYRKTLEEAWQDMTPTQHEAYNWAVSNFTLDQLIAKYPTITPRNVIESEADQYIARHTAEIAKTTASLAENAQRLANDEQHLAVATAELNKITVKPIGFVINNDFFKRRNFEYVVQNDSQYDISLVTFSAWVFVDGEERSERSCRVWGVFQHRGGLQKGKSLKGFVRPR